MKIFIKHILKNLENKIGRTIIILFTLFGVGLIVSFNLSIIYYVGSKANIYISGAPFFDYSINIDERKDIVNYDNLPLQNDLKYLGLYNNQMGYVDKKGFNQVGVSTLDYDKANEFGLIDNYDKFELNDYEVLITKSLVNKLKLRKKEEFTFHSISGKDYELKIKYVANDDLSQFGEILFVNKKTYDEISENNNEKYGVFLAKYNGKKNIKEFNEELYNMEDDYGLNFNYTGTISEDIKKELAQEVKMIVVILILCFTIVYFVLNSIVKIIMEERIPVVGSFRSVGASNKKMNFMLFCEMGIYGFIGGLIGSMISSSFTSNIFNMLYEIEVAYGTAKTSNNMISIMVVAFTTLAMILFQLLISIDEILEFNKMSIKECIFNSHNRKYKRSTIKLVFGIAFLLIAVGSLSLTYRINYLFGLMAIFSLFAAISFILPVFTKIIEKIFKRDNNPILSMAFNTINENKLQVGTNVIITILLCISITAISYLNYTVKNYESMYNYVKSDLYAELYDEPRSLASEIMSLNNIKDIAIISSGYLTESNVKIANNTIPSNSEILVTYSNNINKLSNMTESIDIDIDKWKNLNNNEVIVNTYYKNKYKLKKNDLITISYTKNEKHFSYDVALDLKIIDFANTNAFDEGAIIVTEETANKLVKTEYQDLFVNLIDNKKSKETAKSIEKLLVSEERVKTKKEYNDYITQNIKIEKILIYIIIAAIVGVGLIGIINNQSVAFIERSKEMAILYSTCMSRRQLANMVLRETFISYILCSIIAIIFSQTLSKLVVYTVDSLGVYLPVKFNMIWTLILIAILGVIMLIIYLSTKKKINHLDIVEELKYE